MAQRDMTPDERQRFEEETVHGEDAGVPDSGPASEPEVGRENREPRVPIPPSPD